MEGIGSILNIIPTIEKPKIKPLGSNFQDDYNKLAGDWQRIGNGIRQVMNKYEKSKSTK